MRQLLQVHARLITDPPPPTVDTNLVAVKLISASAARANPRYAALVFSLLPAPNLFAWNSLLRTLALHHLWPLALRYFNLLLAARRPLPDEFTFTSVLKACAGLAAVPDGEMSHALVLKRGLDANLFVRNSLVDMYFKFGCPAVARRLFDGMPVRDVVSWNTLISGYSSCGDITAAREVFDRMPERSMVSWSAMIAGHARSGDVATARELFDQMPERNVVCWNAMIAGCAQNEKFLDSIELFRKMLQSGCALPNDVTLVSVLSACAHLGALDLGMWIDGFIKRRSMELSLFLGNALSDMYAKCGCIGEARRVFERMKERDVISWSIIICGSAMHGHAEEAISGFHEMLQRGIKPNDITFMGILSACTHAGLVDDGLKYFNRMSYEFGIDPKVEHYGCVVDLLSRAGRLDEAENLINSMQVPPNVIVWGALLGGCRIYGDICRGERVVHHILELDPGHSGSYVYLAHVYSSIGRLEDAARCRLRMREKQVAKMPGCSWIEVDSTVHEFFMGDRSHPQSEKIYSMIGALSLRMKLAGYVPDTTVVSQSIDEEEKEDALSMHSEKLAVAFGLISTKEGATIRVVKNLRVCNDCHEAMKFISKIVAREIVLRDRSRFHHFSEGKCSCKDYW
ncbi:pentatricopeptide repeat-containing protein At3g62890-like [Phoenix dactylifera]|uniref:Pentatricopeptide repeat-containing protein At3g62890-like n=1 Tax=Phoenix dactylifera TaxID=42345 RepID=A0A8B9ACW0_PHODC|nr:pentatricopeptide repeat-containing protein At3g62890-like [Phoenix dactylifera]